MLREKLKKYFTEHGIQKKWFAEKLGMSPTQLALILKGINKVPDSYWPMIVQMTNGEITIGDLIADKLKGIECIEIKSSKKFSDCKISLKDFKQNT